MAKRRGRNQGSFREESDEKGTKRIFRRKIMRKEYEFSKMKGRRNPYAKRLKKQVTIRMGVDIIDYFKRMSEDTGIPYQNLINLYLRECVQSGRKISIKWAS
ncbi:MAG: BrnA antitoxin family protein [Deltaproteobacteria bacterium]|nr:BrnA antitoxin family protein [Deltaproteobacteria bacterium]